MLILSQERTIFSANCHARIASEKNGNKGNKGNQKSYNKNYKAHINNSGQGNPQVDLHETCEDVLLLFSLKSNWLKIKLSELLLLELHVTSVPTRISSRSSKIMVMVSIAYMGNSSSKVRVHDKGKVSMKGAKRMISQSRIQVWILKISKDDQGIATGEALEQEDQSKLYVSSSNVKERVRMVRSYGNLE